MPSGEGSTSRAGEPASPPQGALEAGPAVWIPATYAAVSLVWIAFSDVLVSSAAQSQESQAFWSIVKGAGFVSVTAILLHVGIRWALGRERDANRRIAASEARFRALADEAPVGIYETGTGSGPLYLNRAAERILGVSAGAPLDALSNALVHPDDRERVAREWRDAREGGLPFSSEHRVVRPDGSTALVRSQASALRNAAGEITSHIGVLVDVTEQRALQSQLEIARRLSALGTLVAGIGHEVNNPLGAAIASQGFAAEEIGRLLSRVRAGQELPREALARVLETVAESLEDAQDAGQRVSRIVKEFTSFGRGDARRVRTRLSDVVDGAMRWLPTAVAGAATIRVEREDAPDVVGSAGQLQQVIVNLVTNAAKSIPRDRRGHVTVRVGPGAPGRVRVEVSDDGVGMTPEVLERVFDPFFTTRKVGEGMGLGLAISHAIVAAHAGTLTATSTVGGGSTFRVELPAAADPA